MKAVLYGFVGLPWAEHHKKGNHHLWKELFLQRSGYNSYFDIVERCQKDVQPLDPHIAEGGGGGHSPPGVLDKNIRVYVFFSSRSLGTKNADMRRAF